MVMFPCVVGGWTCSNVLVFFNRAFVFVMKRISVSKFWQRIPAGWRFTVGSYLALRLFYIAWSLVIISIFPVVVKNLTLFGEPIVTILNLQTSFRAAYHSVVGGQVLTFVPVHGNAGLIADRQSGSIWDVSTGVARFGEYAGRKLLSASYSVDRIFPYFGLQAFPNRWMAIWQRFDTNWYVSIAERGYGAIPGDIHFPPLYPLLIFGFSSVLRNGFVAGMAVSGIATLVAFKLLFDLFHSWPDQDAASLGLIFFLLFPTTFFLFGAYTEGLFIATAILALRSMQRDIWGWAGFWVFCSVLLRLQGIALFVPFTYFMWVRRKTIQRFQGALGLLIALAGGLAYIFLRALTGNGEVLPLVEDNLSAHITFPWNNFAYAFQTLFSGSAAYIDVLNLCISFLFLALIVAGWKYLPVEYSLYNAATFAVLTVRLVDSQPLNSMIRYVITLFPAFYVLGVWGHHPLTRRLVLVTSLIFQLFLSAQFWMWGWVG